MNALKKWNKMDQIIFHLEKVFGVEYKSDEPDIEEMIAAETEHLKKENEDLKRKQYPGIVQDLNGAYRCPDCGANVTFHNKYCSECGKRILFVSASPEAKKYVTSHN